MTSIKSRPFGQTRAGKNVECYTISAPSGLTAEILTYGGVLRALYVPTPEGPRDVVLGFDTLSEYEGQDKYIGAIVGRVCNRIANARFSLDGKAYSLAANSGPNCLHGGIHGFHEKVWTASVAGEKLVLSLNSPDGEEGFPGTLQVQAAYSLSNDSLSLAYAAVTDRSTPVSFTNHSYFNLCGQGSGTVEEHRVRVAADFILENGETGCPTGVLLDVSDTPFDLRTSKPLKQGLMSSHAQIRQGNGYDHNFVLKKTCDSTLVSAAEVEAGGLRMEVLTTQPGMQLYTANYLDGLRGKGYTVYPARTALCLETQGWPDAVNQVGFPGCVLRPEETYEQMTIYRFLH